MLSFVNPKDQQSAMTWLAIFFAFVSLLLILVTQVGITVELFVPLLPFAFVETLHYRALWLDVKFYNWPIILVLGFLSTAYSFLMLSFHVTEVTMLYVVYAFVIAGVLFGHMRYVIVRLRQIKGTRK